MKQYLLTSLLVISTLHCFAQKRTEISAIGGWSVPDYRYFADHETKYCIGAEAIKLLGNGRKGIGIRYYHTKTNNSNLFYSNGYFNTLHVIAKYTAIDTEHFDIEPFIGIGYLYILTKFDYHEIQYIEQIHGISASGGGQFTFPITQRFEFFTEYQFFYGKLFNNQDFSKIDFYYKTYSHAFNAGIKINF